MNNGHNQQPKTMLPMSDTDLKRIVDFFSILISIDRSNNSKKRRKHDAPKALEGLPALQ